MTSVITNVETKAWELLRFQTKPIEYKIAQTIANKKQVKLLYNNLAKDLSQELNLHINIVEKVLKKLFILGVLAEFEVAEKINNDLVINHYWIFNDYLAFDYDGSIPGLFEETYYAKVMADNTKFI